MYKLLWSADNESKNWYQTEMQDWDKLAVHWLKIYQHIYMYMYIYHGNGSNAQHISNVAMYIAAGNITPVEVINKL